MPPSVLKPPATLGDKLINKNNNNNPDVERVSQREPWERELIGSFLLKMADCQVISAKKDWYVDKRLLRREFEKHLRFLPENIELRNKLDVNGTHNIGSLMYRTHFLLNTPRKSSDYRIKSLELINFRKEKYNAMDEKQQQIEPAVVSILPDETDNDNDPITLRYKLDEAAESVTLKYQKTQMQHHSADFELSSLGCFICQCNFDSIEKYEEHIEYHGDESGFQSLLKMDKYKQSKLKLSYQNCVDSHYFGFTLATLSKDIVIEKFIIVQSRQFYYVYGNRMPMKVPDDGQLVFFVDSHVFVILREQPIVIGFSQLENGKRQHYVEQHHFMRTEELPKAAFNVNPYRLSKNKTFRGGHLEPAVPPKEVLSALKCGAQDIELQLANYNTHFRQYCDLGRVLTQNNLHGALGTLLQLEDIEQLQCYVSLKQSNMELHQFGKEMDVKLHPNPNIMDVITPGDSVLIINERCSNKNNNSVCKLLDNSNLILKLTLMEFEELIRWGQTINDQFGALDKDRKELRVYFARVLAVNSHRVNITCERNLPDDTKFSLIFRPNRAVFRYQYRALEQLKLMNADHVKRLLFPNKIERLPLASSNLQFHNENIGGNPEQRQAVQQIALSTTLPAPYIVFGPPGTGKTATICEAIYQLFVRRPETHILVLAGSNTACDEIALRLLRSIAEVPCQARPLARIFSAICDRRIDNIDDLLLEYSNMFGIHFYPDVQTVHEYRIVVCTLSLAGKLSTGGFGRDENKSYVFSHVFVDEAAASTEAEVLMGITCTIAPTTNLILSGDHKQLGPVLQSRRALEWGLGVSLLERLIQRDCYTLDENGDYNVAVQTRLRRNFRSHREIVSLYSNLYYNDELISAASLDKVCLAKNWFHTTNEHFPIMFHSVFGTTTKQQSSVSLCNSKEIDVVMDYVKDLMYFGINGEKLAQTDIGIISPYKKQYQLIQEQLNMRSWNQIDCGSVELFQGKEKQVIIVSFVRSFTKELGFLNNNRRLNVLLSRPMSLLVLVGNPRTLSQNEEFRHIIDTCRDRRTLVGAYYFPDNDKTNETNDQNANNHENGNQPTTKAKTSDAQALGQQFKRTTTRNKTPLPAATKMVCNKDELLKLGVKIQQPTKKSVLDKLFDELPSVPRYVDQDSDAVRSIQNEMQDLAINKGKIAGVSSSSPHNVSINADMKKITFSSGRTSQICYATEAVEFAYAPSAPPASPSSQRSSSKYSYVPSDSSRFESVRPRQGLSDEYRRPPPYYNIPTSQQRPRPQPQPPLKPQPQPEKKKKSACVIS